ncbi:hypothetical protein FRB99_006459 [Tulasnella sp. 403]|nr:hypothetical protein FRB99_006459 [Tulasnella sp. 403]
MFLYSTGGAVGSATLLQTSQLFTVQGDAKSSTSCLVAATPSPTTSAPTSSSATPTTSCIDGDDGNTSWGAKMSHTNSRSPPRSKLPLIVGLSVGGVAGLLLLLILFYLFRRRRIEGQQQPAVPPPTPGQISWLAHPGPVHPGAGPSSSISAFGTTSSKGKGKPRRTTLDSSALGAGPSRSASGSPYAVDPSIPMPDLDIGALEAAGPSNQFIAPATQLQAQPAATIPPIEPSTQAAQHQDSSPAPTPQPTNPSELPPVHEEASQDLPQQPQQESPGQPPTPPPERRDKTPPP